MKLPRLFKAKPESRAEIVPAIPAGLRIYAIGDIHGQLALLDRLHDEIASDAAAAPDLASSVIYLGDYVDRGLHSREIIDRLLMGGPKGCGAIHLKGNHEQAVLDFLDDPTFGMHWANFGGLETLYSYGIQDAAGLSKPEDFMGAADLFARLIPPAHLRFFKSVQLTATVGDYFFVHAGVKPGVPLDQQSEEDLIWIREEFLESDADFGKIIVHGHTPEPEPVVKNNRIGIDTGAYMTGVLSCVVLEGTTRRFLRAKT